MFILLLQDDPIAASALAGSLRDAGARVATFDASAPDATTDMGGYDAVAIGAHDDVAADVKRCESVRAEGYRGPILVLGSPPEHADVLLDAGADDFVPAPVRASEVIARARMARRRLQTRARKAWGPVQMDLVYRTVSLRGEMLTLTEREFALLACLIEAGGEVVSRAELLSRVWDRTDERTSNLVEVHLSRLRDKLGADATLIETVRGSGYRARATR